MRVGRGLSLLRRRHGLLDLLLNTLVDSVGVALGSRVVDEVDARLDLDRLLDLLLLVVDILLHLLHLLQLLGLGELSTAVVDLRLLLLLLLLRLRLERQSGKLLLKLLLTLGQEEAGHLQLLESCLIHALSLVVCRRCQDLLRQRVHLTRGVHSVLLRYVEASGGGSLRHTLLVGVVPVVSPLRDVMLRLVVRSGSRD